MLSMRKIDRIRSLYYDEGMTMTDVTRRMNCSANTVTDWNYIGLCLTQSISIPIAFVTKSISSFMKFSGIENISS